MQSIRENDFECLASTGVKSPANAMFEQTNRRYPQVIANTRALIVGVSQTDGETACCHLGCEIENPEGFHAVRRHCILIVDHANVAKPEGLDQGLDNLMMRHWAVSFGC